ncbi:hypothetical protein TNCV_2297171 [Trichonephila clavipes]|nr:hypothetical protein TNCV_2297171 [Trichonephila clavipes]
MLPLVTHSVFFSRITADCTLHASVKVLSTDVSLPTILPSPLTSRAFLRRDWTLLPCQCTRRIIVRINNYTAISHDGNFDERVILSCSQVTRKTLELDLSPPNFHVMPKEAQTDSTCISLFA